MIKFFNKSRLDYIISRFIVFTFLFTVAIDVVVNIIDMSEDDYWTFYFREIEMLKSGLLINLGLLFVSIRYRLCWYNKVAAIGLVLMNIVNLIFISGNYSDETFILYNNIFTLILLPIIAILALILLLKKI